MTVVHRTEKYVTYDDFGRLINKGDKVRIITRRIDYVGIVHECRATKLTLMIRGNEYEIVHDNIKAIHKLVRFSTKKRQS